MILQALILACLLRPINITDEKQNTETNQVKESTQIEVSKTINGEDTLPTCKRRPVNGISMKTFSNQKEKPNNEQYENRNKTDMKDSDDSQPKSQKLKENNTSNGFNISCLSGIAKIWNFKLLKNKHFVLFLFSTWIAEYSLSIIYKFTPIRAWTDDVSSQQAAFLVSIIGIAAMPMRTVSGIIATLTQVREMRTFSFISCCDIELGS